MVKVVLGGGIGGLSAAHYLIKRFPDESPALYEATNRVGGWIRSTVHDDKTVFEQGPRTLRLQGPAAANALELLEELNLPHKIRPITRNHPAATKRMIYANNALHTLPSNIFSTLVKQTPFSKPLMLTLMKEYFVPGKRVADYDESIYDFATRRFGSEVGDYLIGPMVSGICAGDAKEISVHFLMESLFAKEQEYGSITKGIVKTLLKGNYGKTSKNNQSNVLLKRAKESRWSIYSFAGGMEVLPNKLQEEICRQGGEIHLNIECKNVAFNDGSTQLSFDNGKELVVDHLVSALPAEKMGMLVEKQHPQLASLLKNIETVSVAVINLKYNRKVLNHDAFGFLVSPKENLPVLGVIFDSCCFPNEDKTVMTVMMGGHWFKKYFGEDSSEKFLLETALEQIHNILGIVDSPNEYKVNILHNCIPQYKVGHKANLNKIEKYIEENKMGLSLCGSSYYGVGVNDVIFSARKAVDKL